ncbi:hypothetical protein R3W88_001136 [Solanum pinnatisectum]|uniref:Pectinesterase inhibitor domain-containing protein n=1 Tax=Solanum pinnatisectum TaxID=50273 RepID=A0AAV9MHN2_9SOLN|nr:hypothetical protein R3W88_001136 [Solanum pinnatisectum]
MAKFWSSSLFFLSFVLVTLFGNLPNVKAGILDDVCPKTINPPLCFQVLRNDPYVYKGDIHNNTTSTYNLVQSILQQPIKDPNMNDQLIGCLKNYKYVSDNLESCNDLFRIANYRKIIFLASAAMYESLACNQGFRDVPPQLKQLSKVVQEFSDLSAVIAYDLD